MRAALVLPLAALAEIAGCFAVWAVLRQGATAWWLVPGAVLLGLFAWALTLLPGEAAGRAFAVYGGIYIAASVLWLWGVERTVPDRWDLIGSAVCIVGAAIILFTPRA